MAACSGRTGRTLAATLLAAFVPLASGRAQAGAPAAAPAASGTAVYEVFALPRGAQRLCPGDQLQILVGVNQLTWRVGATGGVTATRSMPNSQVWGLVANPSIGTLDPDVPVSIGVRPGAGGAFYWPFTFTAKKPGRTTIAFSGVFFPALYGPQSTMIRAASAPPVAIQVGCEYTISLYSTWQLPGERILDVLGVVQSARVVPDADGRFSTSGTMSSTAVWIGGCPGYSRIQHSKVSIQGEQLPPTGSLPGSLKVKLIYDPVSSTTTEGCLGKSKSDVGRPDPLEFEVGAYGGTLTPSHAMNTYVRAVGSTTVVVTRVRP